MKSKAIICILLSLFICLAALGNETAEPQIIEAQIMEVPFYYGGGVVERSYPLLAYDGHVYISIVDMAGAMGRNASYGTMFNFESGVEEMCEFSIGQISKDEWPVSENLAFTIGKAVINETYGDLVNNSTAYVYLPLYSSPLRYGFQHQVKVKFDTSETSIIDENGNYIGGKDDVSVYIDPDTGAFTIHESYEFKQQRAN